ncbi:unnamed protein product [Effrenium voratum]|nr:unnamed protein product [Effrenium voratum]
MFTDAEELEDLPPQDLRKFAEQISISGSPFRPEELARLMDGELDADAEFESCTVEFYAGLDRYFRVTDLAFFSPTEAEHREQLVGSYFQAGRHQVLGNMTYEEEEVVELVEEDCNESNESNASNDSNASNFSTAPRAVRRRLFAAASRANLNGQRLWPKAYKLNRSPGGCKIDL